MSSYLAESLGGLNIHSGMRIKCPSCSPERVKNPNEKSLVFHHGDKGWVYFCHHCNEDGVVPFDNAPFIPTNKTYRSEKTMAQAQPVMPPTPMDLLGERHLQFLESRGITLETAQDLRLFAATKFFAKTGERMDCIGFPYYRDDKMVSAKYRALDSKDFTQESGGAHTLWNIDSVKHNLTLPMVIVEGEIDACTGFQCGIINVVSVPSGAPQKVNDGRVAPSEDKKFSFIWDAHEIIEQVPYVIIATDNDTAGQALAEEIARRIGKDKCRLAKSSRYKDLNEAYMDGGKAAVLEIIDGAEPYPVAGLSQASKFTDRIQDLWHKGTGKGASTGYSNVDKIYTIAPGQVSVITGYPSSGKSNFVDQIMVNLGRTDDWKFAICSFENQPDIHISRLMEIYTERRFFDGTDRMTDAERDDAFKWVEQHFLFMDSETVEPATIESILERAKIAVTRIGIRGLVIDPYNYISKSGNEAEHEFISNILTRVQAFAKAYDVHVFFIAHPAKITRAGMDLPRPDGMAISGGMAWWAKTDCGITVHRGEGNQVEIAAWKIRYRWIGTQGETKLEYQKTTGTYVEMMDDF